MGKANWNRMGYSTNFTLPTQKDLFSLHVYFEQRGMNPLACGETSQGGKQSLQDWRGAGGSAEDPAAHHVLQ